MDEFAQPIDDVSSSTWHYIGKHYVPHIIIYVLLSAALIYYFPNQFSFFVVFVVGGISYSHVYRKFKREFTQQFGNSIGFTYTESADIATTSGKLFETGHSKSIYDVLSGTYQDIPIRIFTFQFTIGSGKSSHTYYYTVFEATMTGTVPDILLFSSKHSSAISDFFSGDESLTLEGDFNKFFRLRVPKGFEQEAYQIFTPDVMANLIDKATEMSFEFVGTKLYIYATEVVTNKIKLQNMFSLTEYLIGLFKKNISSVKITAPSSLS